MHDALIIILAAGWIASEILSLPYFKANGVAQAVLVMLKSLLAGGTDTAAMEARIRSLESSLLAAHEAYANVQCAVVTTDNPPTISVIPVVPVASTTLAATASPQPTTAEMGD